MERDTSNRSLSVTKPWPMGPRQPWVESLRLRHAPFEHPELPAPQPQATPQTPTSGLQHTQANFVINCEYIPKLG